MAENLGAAKKLAGEALRFQDKDSWHKRPGDETTPFGPHCKSHIPLP